MSPICPMFGQSFKMTMKHDRKQHRTNGRRRHCRNVSRSRHFNQASFLDVDIALGPSGEKKVANEPTVCETAETIRLTLKTDTHTLWTEVLCFCAQRTGEDFPIVGRSDRLLTCCCLSVFVRLDDKQFVSPKLCIDYFRTQTKWRLICLSKMFFIQIGRRRNQCKQRWATAERE